MIAEVLAIGDELTIGHRLDTNSRWLARQLSALGIRVLRHVTVADERDAIADTIRGAASRSNVLVISGGLGPTADDLTRHALADVAGRELVLNDAVLAHIRGLFRQRARAMPESNIIQAKFPEGSQVLPNPGGTAPGIFLQLPAGDGRTVFVFALPGVPAEMHQIWTASVAPRLIAELGPDRQCIAQRVIHCFGAGESAIERMLPDLVVRGREPSVGITAHRATITLRVTARGSTPDQCSESMQPTVDTIYRCLGDLIFGEDEDQLEDVVARLLAEKQLSLATAEWGTGGLVASCLASAGDGHSYCGGVTVRDATSFARAFPHSTYDPRRVQTPDLVVEMGALIRRQLGADWGLAVGPFPPVSSSGRASEKLHVALAHERGVVCDASTFAAHPAIQRERSAKQALNLVRLRLLHEGEPDA